MSSIIYRGEYNCFQKFGDICYYGKINGEVFTENKVYNYTALPILQIDFYRDHMILITSENILVIEQNFSRVLITIPSEDIRYFESGYYSIGSNLFRIFNITPIRTFDDDIQILSMAVFQNGYTISLSNKSLVFEDGKIIDIPHRLKIIRYCSSRNLLFGLSSNRIYFYNLKGSLVHEMSISTPSVKSFEGYFLTLYRNKIKVWNVRNYSYITSIGLFDQMIENIIVDEKYIYICGNSIVGKINLSEFIIGDTQVSRSPSKSPREHGPMSPFTTFLTQRYEAMIEKGLQTSFPAHVPSEAEGDIWNFINDEQPHLTAILEYPLITSTGEEHYYDFLISDSKNKFILEYDGLQHFFKDGQERKDQRYMNEAIQQGYSFVRFCGLFQNSGWKSDLAEVFEIMLKDSTPKIIFTGNRYDNFYSIFRNLPGYKIYYINNNPLPG